jgi:hypothetical protein
MPSGLGIHRSSPGPVSVGPPWSRTAELYLGCESVSMHYGVRVRITDTI